MIEIREITPDRQSDINIPNEPFPLRGRMIPQYDGVSWSYTTELLPEGQISDMCFPDENYVYEDMKDQSVFIGAYDGDACIGLAIYQDAFFKHLYLYDLKVNVSYRRQHVASLLLDYGKSVARRRGYKGIYTIGQDNNLNACLFYVGYGFRIGGLDTEVYKGTKQEGKRDILFYLDA